MKTRIKKKQTFYFVTGFIILLLLIAGALLLFRYKAATPMTTVCTRFEHVPIEGRNPALVGDEQYRWPSEKIITVYFGTGITPLTNKIIATANEWHKYCNIQFKIVKYRYESMVKVSFEPRGYGSAIGQECIQKRYNTEPSMYLQGFDTLKDQTIFHRVVLHEFGHVLGIEHELKNPHAKIPWDSSEVYKFYRDNNHWDSLKVNREVFETLELDNKNYSEFDSTSIMIYAVAPPLTKKIVIEWPRDLSPTDKKYIAIWYPQKNK